ncbi:MAG: rRNA maturation RNase YbeY [Pseudomonadota bacterium]
MIRFDSVIPEGCPDRPWHDAVPNLALDAVGEAITQETGRTGIVALALADDPFVAALNRRFRGKDRTTNVLSFPSDPPDASGGPVGSTGDEHSFLGDIALALETIAAESEQSGTPIFHHIAHLVVHGTLHLFGHDHMQDQDAEVMESLEARILARLGIPDPYIEQ